MIGHGESGGQQRQSQRRNRTAGAERRSRQATQFDAARDGTRTRHGRFPNPRGEPAWQSRIAIRRATVADVDAVTELRLALAAAEWRTPRTKRRFQPTRSARALSAAQLSDDQQLVLLALHGHRAVGMLRCTTRHRQALTPPRRVAFVTTVYVHPAWRRRGVLRKMLGTADRWARARGLTEMQLLCAVDNHVGRAAWAALGFEPVEILHRRQIPRR